MKKNQKDSPIEAVKEGKPWPNSDTSNALRLGYYFSHEIRFWADRKKWLIWNGKYWEVDIKNKIYIFAKEAVNLILKEIESCKSDEERKSLLKWYSASLSKYRLDAMVDLAARISGLVVTSNQLDTDKMLFNCENGTIDLKTGKLKPHDPADMITVMAPVKYDPQAECPKFLEFFNTIMDGNEDLISYIQKICGIFLTGDISEQNLYIFHGKGANGKSVLIDTISDLMGDYAGMGAPYLITGKNNEHPTEIADLKGKRLVVVSETEKKDYMKTELVKRLTGDQKLKGRFMRQDYFEFERTNKIILVTNNKPNINETNNAIWRRIKMIPFSVKIPEHDQDKYLLMKLRQEHSGILNWALKGCLEWQEKGLAEPEDVVKANCDYRSSQHPLDDFFRKYCSFYPFSITSVNDMERSYRMWCIQNGIKKYLTSQEFNAELRNKGCAYETKWIDKKTQKVWVGVGLRCKLTELT